MDSAFTLIIDDWADDDLTEEEQALLDELDKKSLIESPGRKIPGYSVEIDGRRNKIFKTLVYKDRALFSIGKPGYYIFMSRQSVGGKRI